MAHAICWGKLMRKLVGLAVCIAAFAAPAYAQQSSATWQRVIDVPGKRGEINNMVVASNGDIIVSGFIQRTGREVQGSSNDAWLARYSSDGTQIWTRTFGGEQRDEISAMKLDRDGSIVVTGPTNFRFDGKLRSDSFVARYDGAGNLIWNTIVRDDQRRIGLFNLAIAADGSIIVSGEDALIGVGGTRALVVRLDSEGASTWQFNPPDFVDGATPTVGGWIFSSATGKRYVNESARHGRIENGQVELFVVQNTVEAIEPARCFWLTLTTGQGADKPCSPSSQMSIFPMKTQPAYATARLHLYQFNDPLVRKLDAAGAVIWERTFPTEGGDGFYAVAATPDGGVVGAGYVLSGTKVDMHNWHGLLMKIDAEGNEVWRKALGGSRRDALNCVAVLPDGSIIVAGYTGSQGGAEDWNPWLMRLNSSGELEGEALKELQSRQK